MQTRVRVEEARVAGPSKQARASSYRRPSKRLNRIPAAWCAASAQKQVTLLDYGAGNVRSLRNALKRLGFAVIDVETPGDIASADKLIFPGVGSYGQAMTMLKRKGLTEALKDYVMAGKPFFGICLGMQLLFDGSDENGGFEGLGVIPGQVQMFDRGMGLPVPHIGWNTLEQCGDSQLMRVVGDDRVYFVHSFRASPTPANSAWVSSTTQYGEEFVSSVSRGDVHATQFHPEKSGDAGLALLGAFLEGGAAPAAERGAAAGNGSRARGLAKRVIACLDVRSNDQGDLVVTKGDQYDVREKGEGRSVRNLGAPIALAARYAQEGADEVAFLNITGFRDFPLNDAPMLDLLRAASEKVFVPLTVGGGISSFTDTQGRQYSALEVATEYFRSGADKISIGSDAVLSAEEYLRSGVKTGDSSIEQISAVYGAQAVVVSIDPRRVYVSDPSSLPARHTAVRASVPGPGGEAWCWWQCTVRGGREARDIDAVALARAVEELGAGEILLNAIDCDGVGQGFDEHLVQAVASAVSIPVIASSGAGAAQHFTDVFNRTRAAAALAAGIFHRQEVGIGEVKAHMAANAIPTRL